MPTWIWTWMRKARQENPVAEEFSLPIRVYIEDTDAGGIVYYVNYLKYMERARTEYMRSLGFGKRYIFTHELMFVVKQLGLDYQSPARLDDELKTTASISSLGGASMSFRQTVSCEERILVSGQVQIACVDRKTMNPKRLPAAMKERLELETAGGASA